MNARLILVKRQIAGITLVNVFSAVSAGKSGSPECRRCAFSAIEVNFRAEDGWPRKLNVQAAQENCGMARSAKGGLVFFIFLLIAFLLIALVSCGGGGGGNNNGGGGGGTTTAPAAPIGVTATAGDQQVARPL
jgi:hypothetical protein